MTDLDAQLLAAHEACDAPALIRLYQRAADQAATLDAACFYLTHAYVFALEAAHPDVEAIRARLVAEGREPA
ncbi:hypothetical protein [Aestuariivita boseongensis]|uniref:hypothetical protein n=1 Tax=Aestuariivita boseongensis TaxID=1470562 RepID=UPI00068156D5|nr:hypothetical protein [Aestuariivita boseongensis]